MLTGSHLSVVVVCDEKTIGETPISRGSAHLLYVVVKASRGIEMDDPENSLAIHSEPECAGGDEYPYLRVGLFEIDGHLPLLPFRGGRHIHVDHGAVVEVVVEKVPEIRNLVLELGSSV